MIESLEKAVARQSCSIICGSGSRLSKPFSRINELLLPCHETRLSLFYSVSLGLGNQVYLQGVNLSKRKRSKELSEKIVVLSTGKFERL